MKNHVFGLGRAASTSATNYVGLASHNYRLPDTTAEGTPFRFSGSVSKLRIKATAPGVGASWTITLQKDSNGSGFIDTAMVLTLSDTNTTAVTTANPVSFLKSDSLRLKIVPSASTAPASMGAQVAFSAQIDTTGAASVIAGHTGTDPVTNVTSYANLCSGGQSTTETDVHGLCRAAGALTFLIVETRVAPGSGKSWAFTVFRNGIATALTCTISDTATRALASSGGFTVAKDDVLTLRMVPTGSPAATSHGWSCQFNPTIEGEQPVLSGTDIQHTNAYCSLPGQFDSQASEGTISGMLLCADATIQDWGGIIQAAPGAGKSRTFSLRKVGTVDTSASFAISDTNTSGASASDTELFEGDNLDIVIASTGSPSNSRIATGCILFITPPPLRSTTTSLVMIRRFTCYSGADTFYSLPMDATEYEKVTLTVWRSPLLGTSPTFGLTLEESTDQNVWSTVGGSAPDVDPGADAEVQYTGNFFKQWFRLKCVLGGTTPMATWWAAGEFVLRDPSSESMSDGDGMPTIRPAASLRYDDNPAAISPPPLETHETSPSSVPTQSLDSATEPKACGCSDAQSGCGCDAGTPPSYDS